MSAMLAYLLNPAQTHGLGDEVLRRFLKLIEVKVISSEILVNPIKADVRLEEVYDVSNGTRSTRSVDVVVSVYSNEIQTDTTFKELLRIGIENKIKAESAEEFQLLEEFIGMKADVEKGTKIIMVFITPFDNSSKLTNEYNRLDDTSLGTHEKRRIYWMEPINPVEDLASAMNISETGKRSDTIVSLLRDLLKDEAEAKISPINEYVRHTIKAFILHISDTLNPKLKFKRYQPDGDILQDTIVTVDGEFYTIIRYNTDKISVFKQSTSEEEENTKASLRFFNEKLNLNVDLYEKNNNLKNTRRLGRDILKAINGSAIVSGAHIGLIE